MKTLFLRRNVDEALLSVGEKRQYKNGGRPNDKGDWNNVGKSTRVRKLCFIVTGLESSDENERPHGKSSPAFFFKH